LVCVLRSTLRSTTPPGPIDWVLPYWSSPPKAVVTTVRSPEYPQWAHPSPKKTFFFFGLWGEPG
jgi:hypothetical protein